MSTRVVCYVAGPFRAPNGWALAQNIRRAEAMAYEVAKLGAVPLCPHTMFATFDRTLSDEFWLDGTLELLRRCDVVLLCEGWEASSGTRGEIDEARRQGMPVYSSFDEFRAALNGKEAA